MPTIEEIIAEKEAKNTHYNEEVEIVLTWTSVDDVQERAIEEDEFRDDLQKVANKLSDKISEMERLKRRISEMRRERKIALDKYEKKKFSLLHERKIRNL